MGTDQDRRKHLLSSKPIRHCAGVEPHACADPEAWDPICFGEFVNDDRRDSQDGGELPGVQSMSQTFNAIGERELLPREVRPGLAPPFEFEVAIH